MAQGKSHHAKVLERLQRVIAKHPEHGKAFTPGAPRASVPSCTMTIQNQTGLTLVLGQYYGVEIDYSVNPLPTGQSSVATIYQSWAPPCGFYMIFTNQASPSDWAGLLGYIDTSGKVQIAEPIDSQDIVNNVSADHSTDKLTGSQSR